MREGWASGGHRWLTVREAAHRAGVSPGGVRYWIAAGRLPARATGGGYLVDAAALGRLQVARRAAQEVGVRIDTLRHWVDTAAST